MNLDDQSMILLSKELYKYPNLKKIDIRFNWNIHSIGLKTLFSKFPISQIEFDFNGCKDLILNKNIPNLFKFPPYGYKEINLSNLEIDDDFFNSILCFRFDEFKDVTELNLRNNKLTSKSIEILIKNLSSFSNFRILHLNGNEIGDEGMKLLAPYLHLLKYHDIIKCSKMGLASIGLKYLLDGIKKISGIDMLDISDNNIDFEGIEHLNNYMKENDNIKKLIMNSKKPAGDVVFNEEVREVKKEIKQEYRIKSCCTIF